MTSETVPCEAAGRSCLRVNPQKLSAKPWDSGATLPITGDIRKGERLQVLQWARLDTGDASAKAKGPVSLQVSAPFVLRNDTPPK